MGRFAVSGGLEAKGFKDDMGISTMELVQKGYSDSIRKALIGAFGKPIELDSGRRWKG